MRGKMIAIIIILLITIGVNLILVTNKNGKNLCKSVKKHEISKTINKTINDFTLKNSSDLFNYDTNKNYTDLSSTSKIKWSELKKSNSAQDFITEISLYDGKKLLDRKISRFVFNSNNNAILSYNVVLKDKDEVIDEDISKEYYNNLTSKGCDVQVEEK